MSELLEKLNAEQKEAVMHTNGPLMIVAGAGTGKTTVVTHRIAWLIEQGLAKPDEVLALTFTEKAANEMEERVDQLLPIGYVDLWISTFHAFCERIVRKHAIDIGLSSSMKLMTEIEILLILKKNIDRFHLAYYAPRGNPSPFLRNLMSHISRAKDECITPEGYAAFLTDIPKSDSEDGLDEFDRVEELARAYKIYQDILVEHDAMDFGDLLMYTLEIFEKRPAILEEYRQQFKFVLVDEFQDTNTAQYKLIQLLARPKNNLTIVGDDDQSIYKFRGASLSNILQFTDDFPDAKAIVLTQNYRSTSAVLDAAYTLIQHNNPHRLEVKERINKQLQSNTDIDGFVQHIHGDGLQEEIHATIKKIAELREQGAAWSDFAILVRANAHAEEFVTALEQVNIPYRFHAMTGLYIKPLILDALAWMRILAQPQEGPAMYRLLSHPELGISQEDISHLTHYCRQKSCSIFHAMKQMALIPSLSTESVERITEILEQIEVLQEQAKRIPVSELFVSIVKTNGLLASIRMKPEIVQQDEFALLQQFYQRLKTFERANIHKHLVDFLDEFEQEREAGETGSLKADIEDGPDVVNIMTIHASKGLEFRYVFVVNLVEQRFPSTNRRDAILFPEHITLGDDKRPEKDRHIEEERRLFYVAITRAKEGIFLLSSDDYGGARKRKPSRFLQEVDTVTQKSHIPAVLDEQQQDQQTDASVQHTLPSSLSFTQLAAFTTCPLQYKFAHILKVPVFGRHSLSFGKSLHNTLEQMSHTILQDGHVPSKDLAEQLYTEQWIDEWYPDEKTKNEFLEKGRVIVQTVRDDFEASPPDILFVEKAFTLKIRDIAIRGRIDRIDAHEQGYEVVDYKTGRPKDKLTWQDKRQLVLYQLAIESCFEDPKPVTRLTYHYLENNTRVSFKATEKDKERLQSEILDTVQLLKESDFTANPGFHCSYCDFKDICDKSAA